MELNDESNMHSSVYAGQELMLRSKNTYLSVRYATNTTTASTRKLLSHKIEDKPWDKLDVDLFELKYQHFLLTVDYFSNFWEVDVFESTRATCYSNM